jgi:thymidylate kinase
MPANSETGLWIAIYGLDGAGKSALVERLTTALLQTLPEVKRYHFRPSFLWPVSALPVTRPHDQSQRNLLLSLIKLVVWWLDCCFGHFFVIAPALRNRQFVIFDRWLDDLLVDQRRYRLSSGCVWFARRLLSVAPRPDIRILLDVPAEVAHTRKAEIAIASARHQRRAYLQLIRGRPTDYVINANRPIHEVSLDVLNLLQMRHTPHDACLNNFDTMVSNV